MLESKETGNISSLDTSNILSFWKPVNKESILKEILDTFFPNGAIYKDKILLSRFFSTSDSITHSGDGISVIGARDNDETRTFYIFVKKYSQTLGSGFELRWSLPDTTLAFHLDFTSPPQITDEGYINVLSSNWDASNNAFTFSFTLNAAIPGGLTLTAVNNNDDYWLVEQYEVTSDEGQITQIDHDTLPTLDSSDLASFIWAASKGKIIKNKLFDCQNLINENYDFIQEVEKISSTGNLIGYNNLSEVFQKTEDGDIYVFQDPNGFHCLTIIDIRNKLYTEISGTIQYYLGTDYNCKINPYLLENRVKELISDTTFYRVRLI